MSSEADESSKTEEATPEKRRKAREEGQFPRSRDSGAVAASIAVLLVLMGFGPVFVEVLGDFASRCFRDGGVDLVTNLPIVGRKLALTLATVALPVSIAAALGGAAMGFVEAGFQPRLELAAPKWSRLNPIAKLKGMFSPKSGALSVALSLGRVVVVTAVAYGVLSSEFETLVNLGRADLGGAARTIVKISGKLAVSAVLALAVLSALDFASNWVRHNKEIRMTRQEVKDEHHQQDGDPQVKMRQRQRARELARRGIAQEVPKCAVVVANPTHISVALRYHPEEGVPRVAAKGYDEVALYIRALAKEHRIPVIENRPLARALAAQVRVGRTIPADLYAAVAEVLALVYRLTGRLGST